ncbi:MAG: hypothetical protein NTU97_04345 [Candidatus Magasanikbacteria bacterium]|nr:hypothetical protein [Candidatus Magasanikbacteria bacterium]
MKKLFVFLFLFSFLLVNTAPALADGGLYSYDPFSDRWDQVNETSQQAFINYDNGLERMIVGTDFEKQNNNDVFWIFPVPADPQKVIIDVVTKFPALGGEELVEGVKSEIADLGKFVYATQLYSLPFLSDRRIYSSNSGGDYATGLGGGAASFGSYKGAPDVVIYDEVNKEGMTTEIITAQTVDGLYNYLRSKGLKIDNGSMPAYNPYIGKNYTFIVSWIKNQVPVKTSKKDLEEKFEYILDRSSQFPLWQSVVKEFEIKYAETLQLSGYDGLSISGVSAQKDFFRRNILFKDLLLQMIQSNPSALQEFDNVFLKNSTQKKRGVLVSFPTDKLYFPLIPTSIYGSTVVPATIRVIGYVSPKVFNDIKAYTNVTYYHDSYVDGGKGYLGNFWRQDADYSQITNVKYTKIEINAPSKMLTEDLWIIKKAPLKTYWHNFIIVHPVFSFIFLVIFNSCLVSLLLGLVLFEEARKGHGWLKFLLVGPFNILTIIGFIIVVMFLPTKKIKEEDLPLFAELKQRGYKSWGLRILDYRKLIFVPAFSAFYLLFTWLIFTLVSF